MADSNLVSLIRNQGIEAWNRARVSHPDYPNCDIYEEAIWGADLAGADLSGVDLRAAVLIGADLRGADLRTADLSGSWLHQADMTQADLEGAKLNEASLMDVKLLSANLRGASLRHAKIEGDLRFTYPSRIVVGSDLRGANLTGADLTSTSIRDSDLRGANLSNTDISKSIIADVDIHGIAVWDIRGTPQLQSGLRVVTPGGRVAFDDLRVAVFHNLLRNGLSVGEVIEIAGKSCVLLLGRFSDERKAILDALKGKLADLGFSPVVFDFDRPTDRDFTETVIVLAGMSRFVVADLTKPRSVPLELQATVPNLMIPFVPILQQGETPFAMFGDLLGKYDWVLEPLVYDHVEKLLDVFERAVVRPALQKQEELRTRKQRSGSVRSVQDY